MCTFLSFRVVHVILLFLVRSRTVRFHYRCAESRTEATRSGGRAAYTLEPAPSPPSSRAARSCYDLPMSDARCHASRIGVRFFLCEFSVLSMKIVEHPVAS